MLLILNRLNFCDNFEGSLVSFIQMGAESSASRAKPYSDNLYVSFSDQMVIDPIVKTHKVRSLIRTAYTAAWSKISSTSVCPRPRTGHLVVTDEANKRAFIGYGSTMDGEKMNDFWELDLVTLKWREIPISGNVFGNRNGARALVLNEYVYVFGGFMDGEYFNDLHRINTTTGVSEQVVTGGPTPVGRSTPIFTHYENKLYLWGGFNGTWPTDLHVLDMQTMQWTEIPQDVPGRTGCPFVIVGHKLYSYGGSKSGGMLILNFNKNKMKISQITGSAPQSTLINAGMEKIDDKHAVFFGGIASTSYSFMYLINLETLWWSLLPVIPDDQTVSLNDGYICDLGLFMVPRYHSYFLHYLKSKRALIYTMGAQDTEVPTINVINLCDAMCSIHMREDLSSMLQFEPYDPSLEENEYE